ncbi:hypothetical protein HDG34_003347 [Paraburkholderia sp. HC6.4b]|uniref:phage head spike fiber domain-containing protein n=1 Tax=unclassified Paraburkholderia TaxID=2615204 RepID=UPI001611A869|nr:MULTISPECIES: hypothetical protein [unclassified Paraburkholderia]MBB5409406.1 hypothetical protein [Paraburkholderia sp. HC6.4b]MBB5451135.1 hypothetical protein [Paraburkholderia sp. Kb1A]
MSRLANRLRWATQPPDPDGPTLDLNFLANPAIRGDWTFTRASAARYFGANRWQGTAASNVARFDHDPYTGELQGLLLEESHTNLLPNSDAPEFWKSTNVQVGADGTAAPDEANFARFFVEAAGGDVTSHSVYKDVAVSVSTSTNFTWSTRLRRRERTEAYVEMRSGDSYCGASFDLVSGTVLTQSAGGPDWTFVNARSIPLRDGWMELRVTGRVTIANTISGAVLLQKNGSVDYVGDGVSGLYHGGSQLEQAGFATSYIPTTSAAATRALDRLTTSNLAFFKPGDGTLLIDAVIIGIPTATSAVLISLDDGSNIGVSIYKAVNTGAMWSYIGSNATSLGVTVAEGDRVRVAIAWSGDWSTASTSINGRASITMRPMQVTITQMSIGSRRGAFISSIWAREAKYWPRRFDDAALSDLTRLT